MKRIAAFVCLIALVSATIASAAPMPWKTFSGQMVQDAVSSSPASCGKDKEMFVAEFRKDGAGYVMFAGLSNGQMYVLFMYDPHPEDPNSFVGVETTGRTLVPADKHDEIPPLTWRPYSRERDSNICATMFPAEA